MQKSADAFRTISEVADWLGVQTHVLRFWESKFSQVKPVKRAGGRRYYRPADMLLLGGIRKLLHDDGLTIKGVQKLLREEGVAHVSTFSQPLDELTAAQIEDTPEAAQPGSAVSEAPAPMEAPVKTAGPDAEVVQPSFEGFEAPETGPAPSDEGPAQVIETPTHDVVPDAPEPDDATRGAAPALEDFGGSPVMPSTLPASEDEHEDAPEDTAALADMPDLETTLVTEEPQEEFPDAPVDLAPQEDVEPVAGAESPAEGASAADGPKPETIDAPDGPAPEAIEVLPGVLSRSLPRAPRSAEQIAALKPLVEQLAALQTRLAADRRPGG